MERKPQDIREKIISLIPSKDVRKHLLTHRDQLTDMDYMKILGGAPADLRKKSTLMTLFRENLEDDDLLELAEYNDRHLQEALGAISDIDNGTQVLLILEMKTETECRSGISRVEHRQIGTFPEASLASAKKMIDSDLAEWGLPLGNHGKFLDFWVMELYEMTPGKTLMGKYRYICDWTGELFYYEDHPDTAYGNDALLKRKTWERNLFSGVECGYSLNIPLPFEPGDLIFVDCSPFAPPAVCLVAETGSDCCALQCIYPCGGGKMSIGALKHSHFCNWGETWRPYLSPLYRAERYTGELPEDQKYMKILSEALRKEPELGRALFEEVFFQKTVVMPHEIEEYMGGRTDGRQSR